MTDLKCKHCGAVVSVDEDKEFATCKYCGSKYKLNEDKNINIKLDDNVKEVLNHGLKTVGKFSIISIVPFAMVFIFILIIAAVIIFNVINFNKQSKSKATNNTSTDVQEKVENAISVQSFNSEFEFYVGTKWKTSIEYLLDKVVSNNRKNSDKLITVVHGNDSSTDGDEIINIKHSLKDFTDYEVKLDYDGAGYVNKVIIEDI